MARPTKLTEQLTQDLERLFKLGVSDKTAYTAIGLSRPTFYHYMQKGEQAQTGKFKDFSDRIKKARAESIVRNIVRIEKAAEEGTWQASAWLLERRHPEEYGRRDHIETDQHHKHDLTIIFEEVTRDEEEEIIDGEYKEVKTLRKESKTEDP